MSIHSDSEAAALTEGKSAIAAHNLTPNQIVELLDKYIIGQKDAKKSVAIALRNRLRRQHVGDDLRE